MYDKKVLYCGSEDKTMVYIKDKELKKSRVEVYHCFISLISRLKRFSSTISVISPPHSTAYRGKMYT